MTQYSESYCLAILITNLKQRKRYPDPITVADCAKTLYDMYGPFEQVSRMVEVHPSVIRKWINLAKAPEDLRRCVKEGKIYPVAAFAILSAFSDNSKRIEVTKEVIGWGEPEIVSLIHYMKRNPHLSVSECKNLLITEAMGKLIDNNDVTSKNDLTCP